MSSRWLVYVIESSDGSYYTGITNNLRRRWQQHTSGKGGAKYFRGRQPKAVVFIEWQQDRSAASRREYQIKQLTRAQKESLVESQQVPGQAYIQSSMFKVCLE